MSMSVSITPVNVMDIVKKIGHIDFILLLSFILLAYMVKLTHGCHIKHTVKLVACKLDGAIMLPSHGDALVSITKTILN